jgi:hypothetical protein
MTISEEMAVESSERINSFQTKKNGCFWKKKLIICFVNVEAGVLIHFGVRPLCYHNIHKNVRLNSDYVKVPIISLYFSRLWVIIYFNQTINLKSMEVKEKEGSSV